jgi:imidazole glycerol-phosphate synthase subunit HisF
LGYGGGIRRFDDAKAVLRLGFEKVVVNSYAIENPRFVSQLSEHFGSQAVIVSIDVKRTWLGAQRVFTRAGTVNSARDPVEWAQEAESLGAGEILLTSIDREGTWQGFDLELVRTVTSAVSIPVIAHGGAGTVAHLGQVVSRAGASAVAVGSMVVFQKQGMGVLVNFPDPAEIANAIRSEAAG